MAGSKATQTALCRAGSALLALSEISPHPRAHRAVATQALATLRRPAHPPNPSSPSRSPPPPAWRTTTTTRACGRCLSTGTALGKKHTYGKGAKKSKAAKAASSSSSEDGPEDGDGDAAASPSKKKADPENADDFGEVEELYARLTRRTQEKLQAMRQGGRFSPDALGRVPVVLAKGSPAVPLSEAALVDVQGGRVVQLTLFEPSHRRAVMSAIQSSPQFNQQPQPDPDDEAVLTLKVEPERLEDQLRAVKEACHGLRDGLRRATAARQKKHAQWGRAALILPDAVVQLNKKIQKMQDAQMKEVDLMENDCIKALKKSHGQAV
ncbi:hypothetical protein GGTG_03978 [Gaeumannomyces tritici R3-111a-1]|uniref:Ribosome recycling factor domain-containing protein n=1 Tax=Gaeumannomyces tritici (strain R3-111a-1) TaxID=644352 RepID=J3NRS8_GAET3|nr:hypothetical protein GGTG_03978 [Gaeumannomyces tritici R3-111a-1]EJT78884.1 hypothetical protein GGTG_03978 [Gaeumannomyces tritici R3-111a-1]